MTYIVALFWGFLGWMVRVVWTYYTHSKLVESKRNGKFIWSVFRKKYDQDWIMGFVAMIAFSLISDWAWGAFLSKMVTDSVSEYDPKVNVLIGFLSIYIVEKLANR